LPHPRAAIARDLLAETGPPDIPRVFLVLAPWRQTLAQHVAARSAMVADGLVCLQMGVNPAVLEARLRGFLDGAPDQMRLR